MQSSTFRDLRKDSLDLLRFPLAIIVIIVHVFGPDAAQAEYSHWCQDFRVFHSFNLFIKSFLRGISVPIYFFISGFVFFLNTDFDRSVYLRKLNNRVKTLLVPYLVWNAMAILLVVVKQLPIFSSFLSHQGTELNLTFANIASCFWMDNGMLSPPPSELNSVVQVSPYPINAALWFIRDLMIVVIASPLIYWMIRKFKSAYIVILGLIYACASVSGGMFGIVALFFFSWGAYMSIKGSDIIADFRPYFKASFLAYLVSGILYYIFPDSAMLPYIKLVQSLVGLVFLFNLSAYLLEKKYCRVNGFLSSASFFLYITHCLLVHRVTKVWLRIFDPASDLSVTGVYVLSAISTVSLLILAFYILKRFFPRILVLVTGRR